MELIHPWVDWIGWDECGPARSLISYHCSTVDAVSYELCFMNA